MLKFNSTGFLLVALLCCLLCFSIPKVNASDHTYFTEQRIAEIDDYIKQAMEENRVPGASIALIESGEIVAVKGYGVADKEGRVVSPSTPFQLASITKTFTALLILQLEAEGKLNINDSVKQHIPWFNTNKEGQAEQITIRHLLQHNSGFSTKDGNKNQNTTYRGRDATHRAVRSLVNVELIAEPGVQFQYSNSNYQIASHIIELLEGKPFEQVMKARILAPLGMKNSYVQMPDENTEQEAVGFPHWFGRPIQRQFTLGRMKMADGGVVASAEDLAKYLLAVQQGNSEVVPNAVRRKLLNSDQNSVSGYALGWQISKLDEKKLYEHSGGNGGFSTWFGFVEHASTEADVGFLILSNSSSALYGQFAYSVRQVILGETPPETKVDKVNLLSLLSLYATILVLCFFLYRAIWGPKATHFSFKRLFAPIFLLSLSYVNAFTVPALNNINLVSIYPFFPDLTLGLAGVAGLSLCLGIVKLFHAYRLAMASKEH